MQVLYEFKGGYQMLYCGGSTPTPVEYRARIHWSQYVSRFAELLPQVTDMNRCIFNVHVPPFGTALDACPKLDKDLRVVYEMGLPAQVHAGCQTLMDIIKQHRPPLGLHGHIHEGRAKINIGKTICINPGSVYPEGILQGALITLRHGEVTQANLMQGSDRDSDREHIQKREGRMSVTDVGGDKRIFLRKASGLIRTAGLLDTFIYNLGVVGLGLGVGSMLYYGPAFYPQGNLIWGSIIAGIAMAMISFGFITWTITLPRSGGIYVFGSRILPPALALTMSLVEITAWLFLLRHRRLLDRHPRVGPDVCPELNLLTGKQIFLTISQTMLQPWATFLIGSVILLLSQVVLSYGMRFYLTLNKWVFILAMASTFFLIAVLALATREQFVTNLNELVGPSLGVPDAYNAIIASGKEKGWGEAGFDLWQTLLVCDWPFLPLIGAAFSIAIGGEIKSVTKSQTVGMLGAVFCATLASCCHDRCLRVFGLSSWPCRLQCALRKWRPDHANRPGHFPAHRNSYEVSADHYSHIDRSCIVDVDVIPAMHTFGVRAIVAWAFDQVAPAPIATISEKYHTPIVAITVTTVVNLIFMALFVFTPWFSKIVILIEAAVLAWSVVLAAGIFFPYLRPQLYESPPSLVNGFWVCQS